MNRKCPRCGNEGAYLCDNMTDPLDCRYYCDKCGLVFPESKVIRHKCPVCDVEMSESADGLYFECPSCGYEELKKEENQDRISKLEKKIDENEQSAKADADKPKLTLVPRQIIYDIAEVREYGNNKYPEGGPDNWKKVDKQRYRDALFRHLLLYLDDPQGVDKESGIKHLKHIACNVAFLCELENYAEEYMTFLDGDGREYFKFKFNDFKVEPKCEITVTGKAEEKE